MSLIYTCVDCGLPYCVACDGGEDQCRHCLTGPRCNDCAVDHREQEEDDASE